MSLEPLGSQNPANLDEVSPFRPRSTPPSPLGEWRARWEDA